MGAGDAFDFLHEDLAVHHGEFDEADGAIGVGFDNQGHGLLFLDGAQAVGADDLGGFPPAEFAGAFHYGFSATAVGSAVVDANGLRGDE